MTVRALGYVGVESPNAKEWLEFGPEVLGMEAEEASGGTVTLRMDDYRHRVTVYHGKQNRIRYLGWDVGGPEGIDRFAEAAQRSGVPYSIGTDEECVERTVLGLAKVTDPAGFQHELFYGLEMAPRSFRPGRQIAGFVTGKQGLGHVLLVVPDMVTAGSFYTDVLGHQPSDDVHAFLNFKFYHCNPRQHSLALAEMPGSRGLHHIMIQLRELDDVGIAYDLCKERDLLITMTLGRHTNDRMVSFYVRTPSGFDIEYGWGGSEIDDEFYTMGNYKDISIWGHHMADVPLGALESVT